MVFGSSPSIRSASTSPTDTVSDISLNPTYDIFATPTWEKSIFFYDYNLIHKSTAKVSEPLISSCFYENNKIAAGSVSGTLYVNDISTNQTSEIKAHENGIQSVKLYNNILLTGSWDQKIKFWDMRSTQPVHTLEMPAKIYAMDMQGDHIVAALSNNQMFYYNIKDLSSKKLLKTRFKYQLRGLKCTNDKVFVCGVEGAIESITYADTPDVLYKVHRSGSMVYTVNCIDVNPINSLLVASGASDGTLVIYNKQSRFKVHSNKENSAITSCKFSRDGNFLFYATGEDWSKGYPSSKVETKVSVLDLKASRISV